MSGAKGFMFFCVNVDLTEDGEGNRGRKEVGIRMEKVIGEGKRWGLGPEKVIGKEKGRRWGLGGEGNRGRKEVGIGWVC